MSADDGTPVLIAVSQPTARASSGDRIEEDAVAHGYPPDRKPAV